MIRLACVVLNYRNIQDTLACLDSLAPEPARDFKVYLVNNFAGDGSGPLLRGRLASSGLEFEYLEPGFNTGFAGGCNLGIERALADGCSHVILLNNDTTVDPGFVPEIRRLAARHPGEILAGRVLDASTRKPSHNIGLISPLTGRVRNIFDPDYRGDVDFVSGCLMVIPREALEKVGGLDERLFMYAEDLDLCMRFKREGFRARYCPSVLVLHKPSSSAAASGLPKEYYAMRNQAYVVLRRGTPLQKVMYAGYLLALPFYKAVRRPRVWSQSVRGAWDGIRGRLGKAHAEPASP